MAARSTIELSAKALERAVCLALGYSADERAADDRPDRAKRWAELVVVVKARTPAWGRAQNVFRASPRAGGASTIPYGQLAGAKLDELPVNLEADAAQVELLIHPVAHARGPVVGMVQLAVNRYPIAEAIWIHDQLPHLRGRGCDLDRGGDEAHRRGTTVAAEHSPRG